MEDFQDRVAVITGAASGIGRSLARRCANEGMRVALADINEASLAATRAELAATGAEVIAVHTDVAQPEQIEQLAQRTLNAFGAVHLLCNNAGVAGGKSIWDNPLADWESVMGANFWGVLHGLRTFVPIMLEQDTEGHIVNTASIAGLIGGTSPAAYKVSKHAVVALTETLYHHLAEIEAKIGVSLLCPAYVDTPIMDSAIHRPSGAGTEAWIESFRQHISTGMAPDELVEFTFAALQEDKFYILPHPEFKPAVRVRMQDILTERNPTGL